MHLYALKQTDGWKVVNHNGQFIGHYESIHEIMSLFSSAKSLTWVD